MKHRVPASLSLLMASAAASAHEGHGLPGAAHWHASDSAGYLLLALVAAVMIWWARRK